MTREERLKIYTLDDTMGAGGIINRKHSKEERALIGQMIEKLRQQHYANINTNTRKMAYA